VVRDEVKALLRMGPLPSEEELIRSPASLVENYQQLLLSIEKPVTDDEAKILTGTFGVDDCFGLCWTLVHLIETAPNWPIEEGLENIGDEWIQRLKDRAARWRDAGYPARSFYKEAGLPDPRQNQDSKRDGGAGGRPSYAFPIPFLCWVAQV
jgi:hypothetical protein